MWKYRRPLLSKLVLVLSVKEHLSKIRLVVWKNIFLSYSLQLSHSQSLKCGFIKFFIKSFRPLCYNLGSLLILTQINKEAKFYIALPVTTVWQSPYFLGFSPNTRWQSLEMKETTDLGSWMLEEGWWGSWRWPGRGNTGQYTQDEGVHADRNTQHNK